MRNSWIVTMKPLQTNLFIALHALIIMEDWISTKSIREDKLLRNFTSGSLDTKQGFSTGLVCLLPFCQRRNSMVSITWGYTSQTVEDIGKWGSQGWAHIVRAYNMGLGEKPSGVQGQSWKHFRLCMLKEGQNVRLLSVLQAFLERQLTWLKWMSRAFWCISMQKNCDVFRRFNTSLTSSAAVERWLRHHDEIQWATVVFKTAM